MSFQADLRRFALNTKIKSDKIVRKVALDVVRELVQRTPVDTGLARSNWFIGYERGSSVDPAKSKNGAPSLARSAQFAANLGAGSTFYIVNNVPYIMRLEFGSSKQAPAGMARVTVARWQAIVGAAVR